MKKAFKYLLPIVFLSLFSLYFPMFGFIILFLVLCGFVDVARNKPLTAFLLKHYFFKNGIVVFLLSPINLFIDLCSKKNLYVWELKDYPENQQEEIAKVLAIFDEKKYEIRKYIADRMEQSGRSMCFFKWYGENDCDLIPEFNQPFQYIKTIGVSVFKPKNSTSWHFGPMRINLRVLYNLFPGSDAFIETQGKKYHWVDNPFFSFDDTLLHRSVNDSKNERYCAFIDVQRPSHFDAILSFLNKFVCKIFKFRKAIFYKNWTLLKSN